MGRRFPSSHERGGLGFSVQARNLEEFQIRERGREVTRVLYLVGYAGGEISSPVSGSGLKLSSGILFDYNFFREVEGSFGVSEELGGSMFKEVELEWTVTVQPDAMRSSAHIQRAVIRALLKDFNDFKCSEEHGYYVTLTTLENISGGKLWERRGCAAFQVRFRCLVFNLDKLEHMFAVVIKVSNRGIMCRCGPVESLFIGEPYMKGYKFDDVLGWVKKSDSSTVIKEGDVVLVKIIGTKWEPATRDWSALGSVNGDFVGVDKRWKEVPTTDSHEQAGAATDGGAWGEPVPDGAACGAPIDDEEDEGFWG